MERFLLGKQLKEKHFSIQVNPKFFYFILMNTINQMKITFQKASWQIRELELI